MTMKILNASNALHMAKENILKGAEATTRNGCVEEEAERGGFLSPLETYPLLLYSSRQEEGRALLRIT